MLAYDRTGHGPPLLLLHGLGGTRAVWRPVVPILAREREVIAPDLPGFGASDPLEGAPPTAANLAAAVAAFCRGLGLERPHVGGNSLGAWVALEMARTGDAASVTGLSPAGLWRRPLGENPKQIRRLAKTLRPAVSAALWTARGRRAALRGTVAEPDRVSRDDARRLVLGWIDSRGYEDADREMRAARFEPAGFPEVPILMAWGDRDRLVKKPRDDRLPPGARVVVLEGCGHTPTWDDPERVARVLLEGSDETAAAGSEPVPGGSPGAA